MGTASRLCIGVIGASMALTIVLGSLGAPAWAGEKGQWRGLAVLVDTSVKAVKVADQKDHSVSVTESDGLIFNNAGGSFLDKARYQVVHLSDSGGMIRGGYKTFTMADGSQVFARYETTEAAPPVFKGKWVFIGGTGKYQGITGQGTFTYHWVAGPVAWDVLEGEYQLP